ncbi:MAG: DapH/DapD/GlmU-related protein, partial [Campylobacter sp.]|nr:DapH/DapD/GlmU-related protein [Campylobacter sp.]
IIHGCDIGKNCIIGMGAINLNGAKICDNSIVAAGAVVTQNKVFASGSLIMGSPASIKRELSVDEIKENMLNAKHYIKISKNIKSKAQEF